MNYSVLWSRSAEDELAALTRDLAAIVDYVNQLQAVDTDSVEPLAHALELTNIFRDDGPVPSLPVDQALANAPHSRGMRRSRKSCPPSSLPSSAATNRSPSLPWPRYNACPRCCTSRTSRRRPAASSRVAACRGHACHRIGLTALLRTRYDMHPPRKRLIVGESSVLS